MPALLRSGQLAGSDVSSLPWALELFLEARSFAEASNQTDGSGAGAEPSLKNLKVLFHWVQSDWIAERRPNSRQELNQSLMNQSRTIVSFKLNLVQATNWSCIDRDSKEEGEEEEDTHMTTAVWVILNLCCCKLWTHKRDRLALETSTTSNIFVSKGPRMYQMYNVPHVQMRTLQVDSCTSYTLR